VAPQSGAKEQLYNSVYDIDLNSNYEAQRASKKFKNVEDSIRGKK
jgi:hypothetical protein